jgi:hypothetical protein
MIRALCMCVMVSDKIELGGEPPITFTFDGGAEHMTGIWNDDKNKITMKYTVPNGSNRLIMGFGPSGSGKTHTALEIIRFLRCSTQYSECDPIGLLQYTVK